MSTDLGKFPHLAGTIDITDGIYHVIFDGIEEDEAMRYMEEIQKKEGEWGETEAEEWRSPKPLMGPTNKRCEAKIESHQRKGVQSKTHPIRRTQTHR